MSGHSKWANIKNKKEKTDNARRKIFTKIGREIVIAVKEGGSDPVNNSKLRDVIAKAKANNVPNATIENGIKKAAGSQNSVDYETVSYEGYGPNGVAVIVECLTDNRNRTAGEVRHYFDKFGGNLGTIGCVSFMFTEKGIIVCENTGIDEDKAMEDCFDCGGDDLTVEEEVITMECDPSQVHAMREALTEKGYNILSAEAEMVPSTYTKLEDPDDVKRMQTLLDYLEENDDVQNVYHNWEMPEDED